VQQQIFICNKQISVPINYTKSQGIRLKFEYIPLGYTFSVLRFVNCNSNNNSNGNC